MEIVLSGALKCSKLFQLLQSNVEKHSLATVVKWFQLKLCGKCLPLKCNPITHNIDQVICSKVMSTISHMCTYNVYINWKFWQWRQYTCIYIYIDNKNDGRQRYLSLSYIHIHTRAKHHILLLFQLGNVCGCHIS